MFMFCGTRELKCTSLIKCLKAVFGECERIRWDKIAGVMCDLSSSPKALMWMCVCMCVMLLVVVELSLLVVELSLLVVELSLLIITGF